jgi:hypothetical protein
MSGDSDNSVQPSDERAQINQQEIVARVLDQASQWLLSRVERGPFKRYLEDENFLSAWAELVARAEDVPVAGTFWYLMGEAALLLGMRKEGREALDRATGEGEHTISLSRAEALVLFDFLWRENERIKSGEYAAIELEHPAEQYAVWLLIGALESTLLEPFLPSYGLLVEDARRELSEKMGGDED